MKRYESSYPEFAESIKMIDNKKKDSFIVKKKLFEPIYDKAKNEGAYYMILKKHRKEDIVLPNIVLDEKGKLLQALLLELKFEEYYALSLNEKSEKSVMEDILIKLQEFPELFSILPSKMNKVTILTQLLLKQLNDNILITDKQVIEMEAMYQQAISTMTKDSIESYKQAKIITILNKTALHTIKTKNMQLENEVLPLLLAESIINMNKFLSFSIERTEFQTTGERSPHDRTLTRSKTVGSPIILEELKDIK